MLRQYYSDLSKLGIYFIYIQIGSLLIIVKNFQKYTIPTKMIENYGRMAWNLGFIPLNDGLSLR